MRVFKFGGASVKDADAIRNVTHILAGYPDEKILVVVSAMGKTTNALEEVHSLFIQGRSFDDSLNDILNRHLEYCFDLFDQYERVESRLINLVAQLMNRLKVSQDKSTDYLYDLIVSRGELIASIILQEFLSQETQSAAWLDVTEVIKTNSNHRSAKINWELTESKVRKALPVLFESSNYIITQGFIGSSMDGEVVTLGREGSDYTGAILAYCMDTSDYYVWKDVDGIMSADPRVFPDAVLLPQLSYREAIEMTYFGAKVIHPKTIQPLQRKGIKLHVRSFTNPSVKGTLITEEGMTEYPPIIIYEANQCLLNISTKDFSFIAEDHMAEILTLISKNSIKINMMRNSAVSFSLCLSDNRGRIDQIVAQLSKHLHVESFFGLDLYTIRHYNEEVVSILQNQRHIYLEEYNKETRRMIVI